MSLSYCEGVTTFLGTFLFGKEPLGTLANSRCAPAHSHEALRERSGSVVMGMGRSVGRLRRDSCLAPLLLHAVLL